MTEPLSPTQLERLHNHLHPARVVTRDGHGSGRHLSYLEAYDIKATLIRIFGYANFSVEVVETRITHESQYMTPGDNPRQLWRIAAMATVRLTIHQTGAVYMESAAASQSGPDIGEVMDFAIKGLALDTPLATPSGWTTMREVQVGDYVLDMDGLPARVYTKSAVKELPCYRLTFGDGQQIICDEEHYWWAYDGAGAQLGVHNIAQLHDRKAAGGAITIPVAKAHHLPDVDLPIDGVHRVVSIEKIDPVPTQCIGVESPTHSYLAGESMVPTHNTAESDALKRCAIYLGTTFGLSLYNNGSTQDVVRHVFSPDQAPIIRDLNAVRAEGPDAQQARERLQAASGGAFDADASRGITAAAQARLQARMKHNPGSGDEPTATEDAPVSAPVTEPVTERVDPVAKAKADLERITAAKATGQTKEVPA